METDDSIRADVVQRSIKLVHCSCCSSWWLHSVFMMSQLLSIISVGSREQLPPLRRLYFRGRQSVCLCVCGQNISKSYEWILMKFLERWAWLKKQTYFGDDPDPYPYSTPIFHPHNAFQWDSNNLLLFARWRALLIAV